MMMTDKFRNKRPGVAAAAIVLALVLTACSGSKNEPQTVSPTQALTSVPTQQGTEKPTPLPTGTDTDNTTPVPTEIPADTPTPEPTDIPTQAPTDVPSDTASHGGYKSLNRTFGSKSGNLNLIMTGLTDSSAEYVIEALAEFDPDSDEPFELVNDDFVDAEKWSSYVEFDDDSNDSNQCWAASVSNILHISGWTGLLNDPRTGEHFASEDEVFTYFNEMFSNRGCEASQGINWIFMGEFAPDWESSHPAMLMVDPQPENAMLREFVSAAAIEEYDLTEDIMQIAQIERVDMNSDSPIVIEGSIGFLYDNTLMDSEHSITVIGLITDPSAGAGPERYKAVILANSDDHAYPDDPAAGPEDLSDEQKNTEKAARPDSYTVYRISLNTDTTGKVYWELKGYTDDSVTAFYDITCLPLPSDKVIGAYRETEGSCSVIDDPDLVPGKLFTTSNTESVPDPYYFDPDVNIKTEFGAGEAINLNFFVANKGFRTFDDEYRAGASLTAAWKVISQDGTVMASGSTVCNDEIYNSIDAGYLVGLNTADGVTEVWAPGKYTVILTINDDHAIYEAYYLNNREATFEFEVR